MEWSQQLRARMLTPLLSMAAKMGIRAGHLTFVSFLVGLAFCPLFIAGYHGIAFAILFLHVFARWARWTVSPLPRRGWWARLLHRFHVGSDRGYSDHGGHDPCRVRWDLARLALHFLLSAGGGFCHG